VSRVNSHSTPAVADVVLPCLDEAEALPWVLSRVPEGWRAIVVDNGSTDGSAEIARELGATVVHEPRRGFGSACHAGLLAATAPVVCFCDCDASLDPGQLGRVAGPVREGRADLVLGRRRPLAAGAWPLHARLANAELARRLRNRTGVPLHDLGPMRAARREALLALGLADRRSGYPLEMVLAAHGSGWRIAEAEVDYRPRAGRSKVTGTVRGTLRAIQDMSAQLRRSQEAVPAPTLLVIAKAPVPGRVKTRLCPPCTPEQAAGLAEAALVDTLETLSRLPAGRRVLVLDGKPGRWLPPGWEVSPQCAGGLDARLADAFAGAGPHAPAFLVGMDTPQLSATAVTDALAVGARTGADAWYGPAADGGFWAFGLARPTPRLAARLLHGVPMSTPETGAALLARLEREGLRVHHLPELTDVDTATEAAQVATEAPHGRFAAAWHAVRAETGTARPALALAAPVELGAGGSR
jgi:glycosyltransferase A (GT-A) superfamily protein (DUF2064 family)